MKKADSVFEFYKLTSLGKIIEHVKIEKVTYFLTKAFKQLLSLSLTSGTCIHTYIQNARGA